MLPVLRHRQEILDALSEHQVLLLQSETGSGKSTQVPQILLEQILKHKQRLLMTQPRRLAVRRIFERIAEELPPENKNDLAYRVRFQQAGRKNAPLTLLTDGLLLQEIHRNPKLRGVHFVILDEVHERSLASDFLIAHLRWLLPKRPDLKLILSSATLDQSLFKTAFDDVVDLEIPGRGHAVERIFFNQVFPSELEKMDRLNRCLALLDKVQTEVHDGNILVFLPSEKAIHYIKNEMSAKKHWAVHPLYARLSHQKQNQIFNHDGLQVILSTNIAETSLTLPNIACVIDSGQSRVKRFSQRLKLTRLPIENCSKSSCRQRQGRAGRTRAGLYFTAFSEDEFEHFPENLDAEILRSNIAQLHLQIRYFYKKQPEEILFLEQPKDRQWQQSGEQLKQLHLMNDTQAITSLGQKVATLPLDPHLARCLFHAKRYKLEYEIAVLVSALSLQNLPLPAEIPPGFSLSEDQNELLYLLEVYAKLHTSRAGSRSQFKKQIAKFKMNYFLVEEWFSQVKQISRLLGIQEKKIIVKKTQTKPLLESLLVGMVDQMAKKIGSHQYMTADNQICQVFPGSALFENPPQTFFAAQWIQTEKLYANVLAPARPEMLLHLIPERLKKIFDDPFFEDKSGCVKARVQVCYKNWVLKENVLADYREKDPEESKRLFIVEGLLKNRVNFHHPWMFALQKRIRRLRDIEARLARPLLFPSSYEVFLELWGDRFPEDINDRKSLFKSKIDFFKELPIPGTKRFLSEAELLEADHFPSTLKLFNHPFPLEYRYHNPFDLQREAEDLDEGEQVVQVNLPEQVRSFIPKGFMDWPLDIDLEDSLNALIKNMPKNIRQQIREKDTISLKFQQEAQSNRHKPFKTFFCDFINGFLPAHSPLEQSDVVVADYRKIQFKFLENHSQLKSHKLEWLNAVQELEKQSAMNSPFLKFGELKAKLASLDPDNFIAAPIYMAAVKKGNNRYKPQLFGELKQTVLEQERSVRTHLQEMTVKPLVEDILQEVRRFPKIIQSYFAVYFEKETLSEHCTQAILSEVDPFEKPEELSLKNFIRELRIRAYSMNNSLEALIQHAGYIEKKMSSLKMGPLRELYHIFYEELILRPLRSAQINFFNLEEVCVNLSWLKQITEAWSDEPLTSRNKAESLRFYHSEMLRLFNIENQAYRHFELESTVIKQIRLLWAEKYLPAKVQGVRKIKKTMDEALMKLSTYY